MECYDVDFYHKENGDCPVDDFLESLDTKMRAKVLGAVALLEANGPQLREPYSKFIGDGIFEIRAKQSSNITRVLYFFYIGKRIVLTNGFIKKTQKTPPEEMNCTPFVRQYGILFRKWGVFVCQRDNESTTELKR